MRSIHFHSSRFALSLLAVAPLCALAADAELDEVIVTGTLREQPLADVAGSVAVLDARTLQDGGQQHFQDVLALVPNLNWAAGSSRPRYFQIRGIGEREQYEGAPNPSVGFLIDDMDFSGVGMPATLFDVRQIEVLRGPQGMQYGANALAGLIVVRSHDPQRDAGFRLETTAGDYDTRAVGFAATGPAALLDSAWRVSVEKYRSDGFIRNASLDRHDTNGRDELTARVKWQARLAAATTLDFTFLHADLDNGYDAWAIDNSRTSLADQPGADSQRANGASLRLTSGAQGAQVFTAIGSYVESKSVSSYDADWGNANSWAPYTYDYVARFARDRDTGTLELRLASAPAQTAGSVAWLVGTYALRLLEDGDDLEAGDYAEPGYSASNLAQLAFGYRATTLALFGQLEGRWTDKWRWASGLRLEQRRAHYRDAGAEDGVPRAADLAARNRMLGGQVSVTRELGVATNAYASLSRGYKAGGFNLGVVPEASRRFGPEYLWNLELGVKSDLAGGRGHGELVLFHEWRKDQQARTGMQLDPGNPNAYEFITSNLPKGHASGVEASLRYALTPTLDVGASLGLLRTRSGPGVDADGNPVASREQAHAPAYTAAFNATWRHPSGFMARVDLTAMDDFYFDVPTDHDMRSRAHAQAHLKVGYEAQRWSVHAWLRNALDKHYAVRGFFFGNEPPAWQNTLYIQQGDPRQLGITAAASF
jgi:iron complex outermembrane recepter protein